MQSHTKENESYRNGPWYRSGGDPDYQWCDSPQRYGVGWIYDILDSHTVSIIQYHHSYWHDFHCTQIVLELQKALQELQKSTSRILKHLKQQGPVREVNMNKLIAPYCLPLHTGPAVCTST